MSNPASYAEIGYDLGSQLSTNIVKTKLSKNPLTHTQMKEMMQYSLNQEKRKIANVFVLPAVESIFFLIIILYRKAHILYYFLIFYISIFLDPFFLCVYWLEINNLDLIWNILFPLDLDCLVCIEKYPQVGEGNSVGSTRTVHVVKCLLFLHLKYTAKVLYILCQFWIERIKKPVSVQYRRIVLFLQITMESVVGGENQRRLNKYACACAIVGSMISIIFGYGKLFTRIPTHPFHIFSMFSCRDELCVLFIC